VDPVAVPHSPTPQRIERATVADTIEPSDGIAWQTVSQPAFGRPHTGFGPRVLGDVEVTVAGGERCNDARAALANRLFQLLVQPGPNNGRIMATSKRLRCMNAPFGKAPDYGGAGSGTNAGHQRYFVGHARMSWEWAARRAKPGPKCTVDDEISRDY
jgi:hypothetical protein